MGQVFKVRQPQLDRVVALKILPREFAVDAAFAERFVREGMALAKLTHPNIVTIFDFGETQGYFYMIMEYVDGVNLRQAMRNGLTPSEVLSIIPKVCTALQYAHDHGVLHRDIKPENILIDTLGQVKIADFGVAKLAGVEGKQNLTLTLSGASLGTPHYMAPEQVENAQEVDHRADIYSLGVVFYELLTGGLPLGRFPAPSVKAGTDPRLDEVVFRTLEKERENRYQSAGEVRTELETVARTPLGMPPPLPVGTAKVPAHLKGTGRLSHKAVWSFVLGLVPLLLLPLGLVGAYWWASAAPVTVTAPAVAAALQTNFSNTKLLTALRLRKTRADAGVLTATTLGEVVELFHGKMQPESNAPHPSQAEIRFELVGVASDLKIPKIEFQGDSLLAEIPRLCQAIGLKYHVDAGIVEIGPNVAALETRDFARVPNIRTTDTDNAATSLEYLGCDFTAPGSKASWTAPGMVSVTNTRHQLNLLDSRLQQLPQPLRNTVGSPWTYIGRDATEARATEKTLQQLLDEAQKLGTEYDDLLKKQEDGNVLKEWVDEQLGKNRQQQKVVEGYFNQPQYRQLLFRPQPRPYVTAMRAPNPTVNSTRSVNSRGLMLLPVLLFPALGFVLGLLAIRDIRRSGGLMRGALRASIGAGILPAIFILGAGFGVGVACVDLWEWPSRGAKPNVLYALCFLGSSVLGYLLGRYFYRQATCWEAPANPPTSPPSSGSLPKLALWLAIVGSVCVVLIRSTVAGNSRSTFLLIAAPCLLLASVVLGFLAGMGKEARIARWLGSIMLVVLLLIAS